MIFKRLKVIIILYVDCLIYMLIVFKFYPNSSAIIFFFNYRLILFIFQNDVNDIFFKGHYNFRFWLKSLFP